VGSVYGGIIFNFTKGKVSRIFFGAAANRRVRAGRA
jgi:hypothetical protein